MLILDRHKLDGNKKLERGFPEGKFYFPPPFSSFVFFLILLFSLLPILPLCL